MGVLDHPVCEKVIMQKEQILEVLNKLGISDTKYVRSSGVDWVMIHCPLAPFTHEGGTDRKPSCGISIGDSSAFNCFSCGCKGPLEGLVRSLAEFSCSEDLAKYSRKVRKLNAPDLVASIMYKSRQRNKKEDLLLLNEQAINHWSPAWDSKICREYLNRRGIDEATSQFWDLRFNNERVLFPVRMNGLRGVVGRSISDSIKPRYKNLFGMTTADILAGYDKLTDNPKLMVVEGFFDMINVHRWAVDYGYDVLSTLTCRTTENQMKLLLKLDKKLLTCAYDQDKAGREGWKIFREMPAFNLARFKWSFRGGSKGIKDLGEFTEEEFRRLMS